MMCDFKIREELKKQCAKIGGQKAWAEKHDISPAFVNDVLHGRRDVTERLARHLGFRKLVKWERI